jgi:CrcB protein
MREVMLKIVLVGVGGFAGANSRYWLGGWISNKWGTGFPFATFVINVTGSFVLGFFMAFAADRMLNPNWRLIFPIGFVGAYTTFSTFEFETFGLIDGGSWRRALVNAVASLIVGFIAVAVGVRFGERM